MGAILEILNHAELLENDPSLKAPGTLRSPEEINANIADLSQGLDTEEFYVACTHLCSMPKAQAVPALTSGLKNLHPRITESSAVLLGLIDARGAINPIIQVFKSRNLTVTYGAMCTLFWFGKTAIPDLYREITQTTSPKVGMDSLAALLAISSYASRDYAGSLKIRNGMPLTASERRDSLEQLSTCLLHDHIVMSQIIFPEVGMGKDREKSLPDTLQLYLNDEELLFIERQINSNLIPKKDEKLPRPRVLRPDFKRPRRKAPRSTSRKQISVLTSRGKGPTNKT